MMQWLGALNATRSFADGVVRGRRRQARGDCIAAAIDFNRALDGGTALLRWPTCPAVKDIWGSTPPQTLAFLIVSWMSDEAVDCVNSRGQSTLKSEASQSTALSHRGPGVYLHLVDSRYWHRQVRSIRREVRPRRCKRTRAHNNEAAVGHNKKLLPRARRQCGENNHHARLLVAVSDASRIQGEIDPRITSRRYPVAALDNTMCSLV
jgi:hypothetical protein